jgi:hypothetical protein
VLYTSYKVLNKLRCCALSNSLCDYISHNHSPLDIIASLWGPVVIFLLYIFIPPCCLVRTEMKFVFGFPTLNILRDFSVDTYYLCTRPYISDLYTHYYSVAAYPCVLCVCVCVYKCVLSELNFSARSPRKMRVT